MPKGHVIICMAGLKHCSWHARCTFPLSVQAGWSQKLPEAKFLLLSDCSKTLLSKLTIQKVSMRLCDEMTRGVISSCILVKGLVLMLQLTSGGIRST